MYIFLAGKPLQHICGKVISLHSCNNSNSYIYLEFIILPEKCKQSKGSIYFSFGSLYDHSHLFLSFSSHISSHLFISRSEKWHLAYCAEDILFQRLYLKTTTFSMKKDLFLVKFQGAVSHH